MSNFSLFRTRMNNEAECRKKFETRFITDGSSPITIHILRLDKDRDATMVFTDAEGPDSAIVFTLKQQDKIKNLLKTDYYTWEDKQFFVYEDVSIPRDVGYIKQKAYQCNVIVNGLDEEFSVGGYFISSLRTYVDTEFQQKLNITDKEQPILVLPRQEWVKIGAKVSIGGKPWKIIDYDAITNAGIVYISLERDFYTQVNKAEVLTEDILKAGIEYSFITSEGYFNSSSPLNIKSRKSDKVIIEVPFGIEAVEITTKPDGIFTTKIFKVEC